MAEGGPSPPKNEGLYFYKLYSSQAELKTRLLRSEVSAFGQRRIDFVGVGQNSAFQVMQIVKAKSSF